MKCVCPMGGDRPCPNDCPLAQWAYFSKADRKAQRKPIAEKLYREGFTMEAIATQLGVSQQLISKDLQDFNLPPDSKLKPAKTATNPKGAGRPKGSAKQANAPRQSLAKRINETPLAELAASLILDEGKTYSEAETATGISNTPLRSTVARLEGERRAHAQLLEETSAGSVELLSLTGQQKLDIHKRRLDREHERQIAQLEAEYRQREAAFRQRVQEAVREAMDERILKSYAEELDHARAVATASRKGALTARQYRDFLAVLHPDNFTHPAMKTRATMLFQFINTNVMRDVLIKAEEAPLSPSAFPRNYADLMAARERVRAERREHASRHTRNTNTPAQQRT